MEWWCWGLLCLLCLLALVPACWLHHRLEQYVTRRFITPGGGSGGLLSAFFPCFFPAGDKEAALRDTLYQRRMHPQRPVCVSVVHRRDFQNDEGVRQAAKYSKVL